MIYRNAGLSVKVIATIAIVLFIFSAQQSNAQTITTGQTGTNGGYYYSFWNAGGGSVTMTLGAAGNYSVTWTNCNNFTCGKGWSKGSNAPVCFTSTFNGGGNGYLAVYGWTTNPLIEYYIVENHGSWTPPGGTSLGTVTSDGGTYKIYKMTRTNAPSIQGTATFDQYWSVRTTTRLSGTITVANHFTAWANLGLNLGTFNYEIMETEGYQSTGSSNVTVGAGCDATGAGSYGNGETGGENKIDFAGKDILVALPSNIRSGPVVVRIFGLSGKRFFESSLDPCNALLKISTPDLPAGAYYLSIQSRDRVPVIPFVKTR